MGDNEKRKRLVYRERDGEVTVVEKTKKGFFSKLSPRNLFRSCKGGKKAEFSMPKVERSKSRNWYFFIHRAFYVHFFR
jgi:hypothetical protein